MTRYRSLVVILAWLLLMSAAASGVTAGSSVDSVLDPLDVAGERTEYVARDPIAINGDEDFARQAAAEGWPGDGSEKNPYVIEGYEIDGSGHGYGIYIRNSTAYFVVTDCYLHSAKGHLVFQVPGGDALVRVHGPGLYLVNVRNGKLQNNVVANNQGSGIDVRMSDSNLISNNIVYSNGLTSGIHLYLSDKNVISTNNVYSNGSRGIFVRHSNSNTVGNNTIADHRQGIVVWYSCSNTFVDNTFSDNERDFYQLGDATCAWHERMGVGFVALVASILAAAAVILRVIWRRERTKEAKR